jgi:hypothetical protein
MSVQSRTHSSQTKTPFRTADEPDRVLVLAEEGALRLDHHFLPAYAPEKRTTGAGIRTARCSGSDGGLQGSRIARGGWTAPRIRSRAGFSALRSDGRRLQPFRRVCAPGRCTRRPARAASRGLTQGLTRADPAQMRQGRGGSAQTTPRDSVSPRDRRGAGWHRRDIRPRGQPHSPLPEAHPHCALRVTHYSHQFDTTQHI